MVREKIIQRSKVLPISNTDIIPDFSKRWTPIKLGEIAFVTKLAGFEYTKYIELSDIGEVPVIRAQNVRRGYYNTHA